jgi:capsular exopolysaccharide synthesis family protein
VVLVLGLVLGGLGAVGVWTLRPDKYTSFALLRVASSEQKLLQDGTRPQENTTYLRTQLSLIRSRAVLRVALRDEKVRQLPTVRKQGDPIAWLEKELVIEQVQTTEVVRVALTARGSGSDLAVIVNAVVDAYMGEVVKGEQATQLGQLNDLQKVYTAAEEKLRQLRESFQGLTRDLKGGDAKILTLKQQTLLDEYAGLKRELAVTNTRARDLELKIATLRLRLAPVGGFFARAAAEAFPREADASLEALVERELDNDPRVVAAEADVAKVREQLRQFDSVSSNPKSSFRIDLQKQLDTAEGAVVVARAARRSVVLARNQALTDGAARQQIRESEVERGVLNQQREALQEEVTGLKKELDRLGLNSVELELRRAEIERSELFLRTVWEQKERLEAELKGSARARVTVLSAADDAAVLNKMGRLLESAAGGTAGLALAVLAVAGLELRRNRIHTPTDISQGLRLRVLGALPELPTGAVGALRPEGPTGPVALESVNGLRTALMVTAPHTPGGRGTALMVASAGPDEGKSTVAVQLAASFARTKRRTLLVDCDLRAPSLHIPFGLGHAPGVCEALVGDVELTQFVQATGVENLDLLPAGRFSADAEAGLARPALVARLLNELRARYDYIVIDSSPVLLVSDALLVAGCVDGLLLSVRSGVSRAPVVYAGYERFAEHRLPVLGVVVNGVAPSEAYARGYGRPLEPAAPAASVPDRGEN